MATPGARRSGVRLANRLADHLYNTGAASWASKSNEVAGEIAPYGSRMASQLAVKNRMRSVKNIQKITKAMKMVAASKLRGVQVKAEQSRGLWQPFTALLGDTPGVEAEKVAVMTLSTDRGLCGGINSTSVKFSRAMFNIAGLEGEKDRKYVVVGEKGKAQLQRDSKSSITMTISETQKLPINFTQVCMIAEDILKNVEFDKLHLVFNRFNSVVSFAPTVATVLSPETLAKESAEGGSVKQLEQYEVEGGESQGEMLQNLHEFQLASVLYNASLESACSEQGARMSAMDSSTRNASDMLDRLTLSYNRSRQATITTELIEIISGAAALEAAS
eukprot:jgi/Mesen1/3154/ME000184S02229